MITIENVSRETINKLNQFIQLLLKWNSHTNLIGKGTIDQIWTKHVLDSLQLINFIPNLDCKLIDIGSGGGFPGIVLSILGVKNITLIESNQKKFAFLFEASKLSCNKINLINEFITYRTHMKCDIITARAFGTLDKIFKDTSNIRVKDKYLLLKGSSYLEEIALAKKMWNFVYNESKNFYSPKGIVLCIEKVKKLLKDGK